MHPVAIVIHAYYEDVLDEILAYIDRINSIPFKLYVTCIEGNKDRIRSRLIATGRDFLLEAVANRGRDVLPFLSILPKVIDAGHETLIKVHTKKSPHREDGQIWLRNLLDTLLTDQSVSNALNCFKNTPNLGLLVSEEHIYPMSNYFVLNAERILYFAKQLGVNHSTLNRLYFAAGSMFFARTSALVPLLSCAPKIEDFELESGQLDGTMAHAIERVISLSVYASQHSLGGIRNNGELHIPEPESYESWLINKRKKEAPDRDAHIANYVTLITQRDTQIDELSRAVDERDEQIANLNQVVKERNGQIAHLQQRESELQNLSNELSKAVKEIHLSTSWRITKPLRMVSQWGRRFKRLVRIYQDYQQRYPGFSGFKRLTYRCIDIIRKGGFKGLRSSISLHERSRSTALQLPVGSVLVLDDNANKTVRLPKDVAVHAHIYYPDLAPEIRSYLVNIPVKFHFYVTTDTQEKAKLIKNAFSKMENILALDIRVTENRGRDIFPMLVALGAELVQHEMVLHIHTKRSPHNAWELAGWRRYMMESLLGNPQRVTAILEQFVQDENLGILFPDPYHPVKPYVHMGSNTEDHSMEKLLSLAGKRKAELKKIDRTFFPAGDMFWFRGKAIKHFVDMRLSAQDFEPEQGQVDATLAHAIERMFPYFASEMGLITKSYFSNSFLSQQCSAHQFELFHSYIARGLILNPTLLFDHNIGGGTNTYTRELVKTVLADGGSVLRVYNFLGIWFVQWIADGDGMLFYTRSIEELLKALHFSHGTSIIVNSLYGCPDIKEVISKILGLVLELKISLDVKMHDFFAVCSSQHLSDFKGVYCGVPQDYADCSRCLKSIPSWYPNRSVDIVEWRKPFVNLIEAATTLTFFDKSSIEIFRRAFHLEDSKIRVVPHEIGYFKCDKPMDTSGPLHIGILGTLTHIKGGEVVYALSDYIKERGLPVRITVVGQAYVDTPPHINVHGPYEPNHLPSIVEHNGINVILAPSIVPETFGYTISEAMKMGLPIVAFDLGAQGSRVKQYELGKVVSLGSSPEDILAAIQSALKKAQELTK